MTNKSLSFLILLFALGLIVGAYLYFFVFYGASVVFRANVTGYNIEFKSDALKNKLDFQCEEIQCIYEEIPPLDFQILLTKDGYEDLMIQKKIPGKGNLEIDVIFKKQTELVTSSTAELALAKKIDQNKVRLQYRRFFTHYDFGDQGVFYIREYLGKLFLYRDRGDDKILIYDFPKVSQDKIHIAPVYGTDYFTIYVDGINYIFDNNSQAFRSLDLKEKIKYGKKDINNSLLFITEVGAYIHDISAQKTRFYYPFSDYVIINSQEILGVLNSDDINKRKNLGVGSSKVDQVYHYHQETKEIQHVHDLEEELEEIYQENNKVYIQLVSGLYELQNYEL